METVKYLTQESIYFWEHFSCPNPVGGVNCEKNTLEEFRKQLMSFKRIIVHPQTGYSMPRVIYSGKSQGGHDDLIMTLTMGIYWITEFTCQRIGNCPYEMFT